MQPATDLWPLLLYAALVIGGVAGVLGLSYFLGGRQRGRASGEPYESGIRPIGSTRERFPAQFYLIAALFVIFDLEAAFLFTWAIAFREVGWEGYVGAVIFIGVLLAALAYEWKRGALDWATGRYGRAPGGRARGAGR